MKILDKIITANELKELSDNMLGDLVKAVVDVEKEIIAFDAELHSDLEALLLEKGSNQENLWGINFYPDDADDEDFIEFDSMINLRPNQNNRTRSVDSFETQQEIINVVNKWIKR